MKKGTSMKVLKLVGLLLITTIIFSEEKQTPDFTYAGSTSQQIIQ